MNPGQPPNLPSQDHSTTPPSRIIGKGEMADRVRAYDWASTPLGPIDSWSKELLTIVNLTLASPLPARTMWSQDFILIYNDAYRNIVGPRHPAALGKGAEIVYPESWHVVGPLLNNAFATGETLFHEKLLVPLPTANGIEDRYLNYSFNPIFEDGKIAGLFGPLHDVTTEVLAVRQLEASEARAHRILQRIGDAVIVTDAQACITHINPIAQALTGWSLADAEGRPLSEIFCIYNETTREPVESPAAKVQRLGTIVGLANHTILKSKDGTEHHIDDSGAPIRNEAGELTGIVLVFRDIGERRAAERERDRLTRTLSQVQAATTDGILAIDRNWNITYLNPSAQEYLTPSGTILNKNFWESFPGTIYENSPYVENYYRAMDQRTSGAFEAFYPAPLNAWFNVLTQPSEDGIVLFFRDITQQRAAERERDAAAAELKQVLETTTDGIISVNRDWRITYRNDIAANIVAPIEIPTGKLFWEAFPLANYEGSPYLEHYNRAMHDGLPGQFDAHYSGPLNIWVEVSVRPAPDGIVIFFRDVTHQRANEESLRLKTEEAESQRAEIESVYHTAPIGLALFDVPDFRYLRLNERQASFFGLKPEQVVGRTLTEMAPIEGLRELFEQVAAGIPVVNYPLEGHLLNDPTYRYWTVSYYPVYANDGTVQAITAASLEVTSQKKTEKALLQSEKLAAVGRLASSIAHEINNPLESVMNLIYLARQQAILPAVQDLLDSADQEIRRVSVIANQTLRFHKQPSNPQAITASALFATVLSVYEGKLRNSNVSVETRFRTDKPVVCFEGDIRQVLSNLIGNAIDAMVPNNQQQSGRLFIRSRVGTDWTTGRQGLVFTVGDTGSGMSRETMANIYEPFFTTKGIAGTGLGLWVSKEIVTRHDGVLRVRSCQCPGRSGTTFALFLPFEAAQR